MTPYGPQWYAYPTIGAVDPQLTQRVLSPFNPTDRSLMNRLGIDPRDSRLGSPAAPSQIPRVPVTPSPAGQDWRSNLHRQLSQTRQPQQPSGQQAICQGAQGYCNIHSSGGFRSVRNGTAVTVTQTGNPRSTVTANVPGFGVISGWVNTSDLRM